MSYYPSYTDRNFENVVDKYEFASHTPYAKKSSVYQEPQQLLLQNYISTNTGYDNILLYHKLGVGKTCTAISIAEGFKEYISNMGRKVVVLIKNKNIQRNFFNELLTKCTDGEYISDVERNVLFGAGSSSSKAELQNKITRTINKTYQFMTYGTFVNRVLGMKDFEKDEYGNNTSKVKVVDGKAKRKQLKLPLTNFNNTVIIVDEAHNVTNNDVYVALHKILGNSYNYRLVLLTATPLYDNCKEIFEISNLLNVGRPEKQFPIRNDLYKPDNKGKLLVSKYQSPVINTDVLKGGITKITEYGLKELEGALVGMVSYLRENVDTYPSKINIGTDLVPGKQGTAKVVYCQMSEYQYKVYMQALKLDLRSKEMIDLENEVGEMDAEENALETQVSIAKSSSLYKNSSDAATMVYPKELFGREGFGTLKHENTVLTTNLHKYSCKLSALLHNIKQSPGSIFIYSNYVSNGGTSLIRMLLDNNGYTEYRSRGSSQDYKSFVVYDESTPIEEREKLRRMFNSADNKHGKLIKIIIGSPLISEGITLKNVRQVHVMEPSWNMSRINQIIGRAVRNHSHDDLPKKERDVSIFMYVATHNPKNNTSLSSFFVDKEKYVLSEEKDRANKEVERLLKMISFDCTIMKSRNMISNEQDGTAQCDYTACDYTCKVRSSTGDHDKSTYNLYIQQIERRDIKTTMDVVSRMFQRYFVWSINDIVNEVRTFEKTLSDETIYTVLGYIVENKTAFTDMYGRDGFLINKGELFIFNPSDVDIDTSMYSKLFDFSVDKNKFKLSDYVARRFNLDEGKHVQKKTKKKETSKLSALDIKYNNNIIQHNAVFGTYRTRPSRGGEGSFGENDGKFRIVDKSKTGYEDEDKRKVISGMFIGSYKKGDLIEIAKKLNISPKYPFEEYDKEQLGKLVEKHMSEHGLVLR